MRTDKQKKHDAFVKLIIETIAAKEEPTTVEFEDFTWAAMKQEEWSKQLGFTTRTLRGLAKQPPIIRTKTTDASGTPVVLYRAGVEQHLSPRHLASIMAKIFRKKYGQRRTSRRNWGCLFWLAQLWPEGQQVAIFKHVIANWSEFMVGVKFVESSSRHAGKYYEFPVIALIRKHYKVAVDMYATMLQGTGQVFPPSLKALGSAVWVECEDDISVLEADWVEPGAELAECR